MITINIERISNWEYSFRSSNKEGIRHVARALTYKNPDPYAYSDKIEMFDKRAFTFKIGMLSDLLKKLKSSNVPYTLSDYVFELPAGLVIDSRMSGKYVHQQKAVEAFYKRRFGIIVVPTRGGKTFIASEIIRIFLGSDEGQFLFVVDTVDLLNQATKDIKQFFEPYGGIEIGEIKNGIVDVSKRVTIGMIQTIQSTFSDRCKDKVKKSSLDKFIKNLKFLCIDEIHDNCSDSRLKIYKKSKKLEYLLCLSATPYRAETFVQNLKLKSWSGDVLYTITEETLRQRKVLSDYKVFLLLFDHNDFEYDLEVDDYNEYRKKLIFENVQRNSVLLKVIDVLRRLNLKTLILFQSIEHGEIISTDAGITFISGKTKTADRAAAKDKFLEGEGGFLMASGIFKKGITLPEAQIMINVDGGLENSNTIQKKGRVLGTTATKSRSLIIDFLDIYDCYFSEHSETRLNTYIDSIGEPNVGILDTSIEDCYQTLEKWTKLWFTKESGSSDTR